MRSHILPEQGYKEKMNRMVVPYLLERKEELRYEREKGNLIYCACYTADDAKGVVLISHGFTETAEKYLESIYYFLQEGYHVYCMEHCGHGQSYRMTEDLSLVHVDRFERYVDDLLFVAKAAKEKWRGLPLMLYGHSMGGGIAAAAAAKEPDYFSKVVLSSPMIRPVTKPVPWAMAKLIAQICCTLGREKNYIIGQKPYRGQEQFEKSASVSRARFEYYQEKRVATPEFHMNAASYSWLRGAGNLNRYLQRESWKHFVMPILVLQADGDTIVSNREMERFVKKVSRQGNIRLVKIYDTKHEIFNAEETTLKGYWEKIFAFLDAACDDRG